MDERDKKKVTSGQSASVEGKREGAGGLGQEGGATRPPGLRRPPAHHARR